jgi:hypothetical protein
MDVGRVAGFAHTTATKRVHYPRAPIRLRQDSASVGRPVQFHHRVGLKVNRKSRAEAGGVEYNKMHHRPVIQHVPAGRDGEGTIIWGKSQGEHLVFVTLWNRLDFADFIPEVHAPHEAQIFSTRKERKEKARASQFDPYWHRLI